MFSKEFLGKCIAKIGDTWDGLSLKLIPAADIPLRPRARVWLPRMEIDRNKLLECLKLMNPEVPMDGWTVIRVEEPQDKCTTVVLSISEQGASALEKVGYKLSFGVREAKVKVFRPSGPGGADETDEVDTANQLLTKMQLQEPPATSSSRNDAESRAD